MDKELLYDLSEVAVTVINNSASVTANDQTTPRTAGPIPLNGNKSNLSITKEITSTEPTDGYYNGDTVIYQITVNNSGDKAHVVTVVDTLANEFIAPDPLNPTDSTKPTYIEINKGTVVTVGRTITVTLNQLDKTLPAPQTESPLIITIHAKLSF